MFLALNYVYPRIQVENHDRNKSFVNGLPDFLADPQPHVRVYGLQLDDLLELVGSGVLKRLPLLTSFPSLLVEFLTDGAVDRLERFLGVRQVTTTGTTDITAPFDLETTFYANATDRYRIWFAFDVVVVALGKPELDIPFSEIVQLKNFLEVQRLAVRLDGAIENHLEVACTLENFTLDRVGDGTPTTLPGRPLTVTKAGSPYGLGAFYVRTDDAVAQLVDSEAAIAGSSAVDWVGPERGEDRMDLRGRVTDFVFKGEATVRHDGAVVSPGAFAETTPVERGPLSNTLRVESTGGGRAVFGVTVTGELAHGEHSEATIRGRSALDWVGPARGVDDLRFSGEIERLVMKGDADVTVNGDPVYPPIVRAAPPVDAGGDGDGDVAARTLTVAKGGAIEGRGAFALTVSGAVHQTDTSEATICGRTAVDWVGPVAGTDTLRFTGDVEQFLFKGTADVYLDGDRVDPGSLGSGEPGGTAGGAALPNTLRVTKEGVEDGTCVFAVTVSGEVAHGESSEAVIRGQSALDWVGPEAGSDEVRYSGAITGLVVKGPGAVYRNGDRIDPDEVG